HGAAADGHVEAVRDDRSAPGDLPREIDRGDDGRAEDAIDELSIGGGSGRGISAAGPAAEVRPQPRTGRHGHVPPHRAVEDPVTRDVMLWDDLLAVAAPRRPQRRAHGHRPAPHDRAGVTLAYQRRIP